MKHNHPATGIMCHVPLYALTETDAANLSRRMAAEAAGTIRIVDGGKVRRMTNEEVSKYAGEIHASIRYFNRRDPRHAEVMRYKRECKLAEEKQKEAEQKRRQKTEVYVI